MNKERKEKKKKAGREERAEVRIKGKKKKYKSAIFVNNQ